MQISINIEFNYVSRLEAELEEHSDSLISVQAKNWMREHLKLLAKVVNAERDVLINWNSVELPDFAPFPETVARCSLWKIPLNHIFWLSVRLRLGKIKKRENSFENTRNFYVWLSDLLRREPSFLRFVNFEFISLSEELDKVKENLTEQKWIQVESKPVDLSTAIEDIETGTWSVPIYRSLYFLNFTEKISSEKIAAIVKKELVERHRTEFTGLIDEINKSLQVTISYLKALRAYIIGETEDEEEFKKIYPQRATKLIDRFHKEATLKIEAKKDKINTCIRDLIKELTSLRNKSWSRVRRKFFVEGLARVYSVLVNTRKRFIKAIGRSEERLDQWLNDSLKPALGITHRVKIQSKSSVLDPHWTAVPDIPEELSEIILDGRNPSLLVIPPPVYSIFNDLRTYYNRYKEGNLVFNTDHLAGAFSMVGYVLPQYFRDQKYRIYRHKFTRPLAKLPEFEEDIVFLENFERMVVLNEKHYSQAGDLVEEIVNSPKLIIIAVNKIASEYLRAAIPAFSKFLFEINFSKYEFSAFKSIIEKRLIISAFEFSFEDESNFWSKIYQVSSGIPGVALRIFLKCITKVEKDRITVKYDLPDLYEYFKTLSLEELLLIKKLYIQPYIDTGLIANSGEQNARIMLRSLYKRGLLVKMGSRYAIRPELCGSIRDYLMQINMA